MTAVRNFFTEHRTATFFVIGVVIGAAIPFAIPLVQKKVEKPEIAPGEYLYLDTDRVGVYLGQLRGGVAAEELRRSTTSRKAEGQVGSDTTLKVGGSLQEDQFREERVSPTAADRSYELRGLLDDSDLLKTSIDMGDPPAEVAKQILALSAGDFVEIRNARLAVPTYAALLPRVTYAGIFTGIASDTGTKAPVLSLRRRARVIEERRQAVNGYLRRLPKDPRVPARIEPLQPTSEKAEAPSVFLPLRYSKLSNSPSLISGRITVLAKLIRVVRPGEPAPSGFPTSKYLDIETRTSFTRALRRTPPETRKLFGLRKRSRIEPAVESLAKIGAPGLVAIPVAIYH